MGYETGSQSGKGPHPVGSACHAEELDFLTEQVTEQVRWACEITVAPVDYEMDRKGRNEGRESGGGCLLCSERSRGPAGGCASENGEKGLKTRPTPRRQY